jgi:hypothetical protein
MILGAAPSRISHHQDQRSKLWEIVPDKGYMIVFCEDPFGNIIEIYSDGYEQTITSLP